MRTTLYCALPSECRNAAASCDGIITRRRANWVLLQCGWPRLPNLALCLRQAGASARSRTWESVAGDSTRPARTERRKDETDFEDLHCLGSEPVRIRVFRDGGSRRSRRRILHYEWRSSSSWLRLSEHGAMQGRVLRHRRRMFARSQRPVAGECPSPSTRAGAPAKRAPFHYDPQSSPGQ